MFVKRMMNWAANVFGSDVSRKTPVESSAFVVPVLCYHSWAVDGRGYESDNHLALESDLKTLAERSYRVIPLPVLVEVLRGERSLRPLAGAKLVGLSFDDGWDYDYCDIEDERGDRAISIRSILKQSQRWLSQCYKGPRGVSFVIASPEARAILDRTCGAGLDRWRDAWWAPCAAEDVLGIANHSWDHVHDTLPVVRQRENKKGSFLAIDSFEDAEGQIADAQRYINEKTHGRALPLFGYPYGHVSAYLRDIYFAEHGARLGLRAAFGTGGTSVRSDTPIWDIPRFVCGEHWKTKNDFSKLLDAVERGER